MSEQALPVRRTRPLTQGRVTAFLETIWEHRVEYSFILPVVISTIALSYYPFVRGVWISFHKFPIWAKHPTWVGLQNYAAYLTDPLFHKSLWITVVFSFAALAIEMVIGLGIALVLNQPFPLKSIATPLVLAPYMIAPISAGVLWGNILSPAYGLVSKLLRMIGLPPFVAVSSPANAMAAVIIAQVWKDFGWVSIIYLSALKGIPNAFYEVADIYGANLFQKFRYVTLPSLRNATLVAIVMRTAWNFMSFAQPLALTGGGPGNATTLLPIFIFNRAFKHYEYGLGYAQSLILMAIMVGVTIFYIRVIGIEETEVMLR